MRNISLAFIVQKSKDAAAALTAFFKSHFGSFAEFIEKTIPGARIVGNLKWNNVQIQSDDSTASILRRIQDRIMLVRTDIQVTALS